MQAAGVVGFAISADGSRVVYAADQDVNNVTELYSVQTGEEPIRLNGSLVGGQNVQAAWIAPDGLTVAYVADQDTPGVYELYSVPIDGSAAPTKISGTMTFNGDVNQGRDEVQIRQDSWLVVYMADQDYDGIVELYSTPIDGSAAPIKLNGTLAPGGDVESDFQFALDGAAVVYRADQSVPDVIELLRVPVLGGDPTRLSLNPVEGGNVESFSVSPPALDQFS